MLSASGVIVGHLHHVALSAVCSYDTAIHSPNLVDAAPSMAVESQAGGVGNIESGYLVQWCCDMWLRGAERRKDQGRRSVKTDRRLAEDDAGGGGHGRILEVGIDICINIRPQLASAKEKVEQTCWVVIDAFDPSKISAGRRPAHLRAVMVQPRKRNRQDRQEDWMMLHLLGKSPFAVA
jgi:hypothetical protein